MLTTANSRATVLAAHEYGAAHGMRRGNPQRLDEKAGDGDRSDEEKRDEVAPFPAQADGAEDAAPHEGRHDSTHQDDPGRFGEQLEGDEKIAVQQPDAEVVLQCDDTGHEEQGDEGCIDGQVDRSAGFLLKHPLLT